MVPSSLALKLILFIEKAVSSILIFLLALLAFPHTELGVPCVVTGVILQWPKAATNNSLKGSYSI